MITKLDVLIQCVALVEQRLELLHKQMAELRDGALHDTKSSAGDKHETARAMMQLEQEKLNNQIHLKATELTQLRKLVQTTSETQHVINGSLVFTNRGTYFIAVSLGRVDVMQQAVMVISAASPLAKAMFGKRKTESFTFNLLNYQINNIT